MQSKEKDNLVIIRLFKGEDVYAQLELALKKHQVKAGVFVSGIGQLGEFELGFFKAKGNYLPETFKKPAELVSLSGIVSLKQDGSGYDFHLHTALSFANKEVKAGHFLSGKVSVTLEVVL
ncbi:DUF296 domain-containing protein, partial [Candidatus Gribaldobacteria bacterium]|nr:DUF296 domain-containing protein [Candidatus Gribaldobacteria bacterium]